MPSGTGTGTVSVGKHIQSSVTSLQERQKNTAKENKCLNALVFHIKYRHANSTQKGHWLTQGLYPKPCYEATVPSNTIVKRGFKTF